MQRLEKGFTLIELMIVVVIIGILAAIAIPNYIAMQDRAKEGSTKENMHTFQLSSKDYGVQWSGTYARTAAQVAALLPGAGGNFKNPLNGVVGAGCAWEDRATLVANPTATSGLASYADSTQITYNIKGVGKAVSGINFPTSLVLTAGK